MSPGTNIIDGISKWIRKSVGPEAENRGDENNGAENDEDDEDSEKRDSPVCCSAASSTDVTVLDP